MIMTIRMKKGACGIITAAFLTTLTISLSAQEGTETGIPAINNWRQVIAEHPDSTEDLYIKGEAVYKELYRTTGERVYIDSVLMILSQRTLYFNNKPSIDLHKSLVLFELGGNDTHVHGTMLQSYKGSG